MGDEIIVQVEKEERGNKGVSLTTMIALASTYMVLLPQEAGVKGISRRISSNQKGVLRDVLKKLQIPESMGVIIRTVGTEKEMEDFQWSLDYLISLWRTIESFSQQNSAPCLIYKENTVIKILRDYLRSDIDEVLVDEKTIHETVLSFADSVMDKFSERIKLYKQEKPLLAAFGIEKQAQRTLEREISLPSKGSIVFDSTEALVAIDINSSKSTKGSNIEETALHTNLEAAKEIARQLRLRDIGGLVVIDFIDMRDKKNRDLVQKTLLEATRQDRARTKIGTISNFGLLELSRQRLGSSMSDSHQITCPQCLGIGLIPTIEVMAVSMIRKIEAELSWIKLEKEQNKREKPINRILLYLPNKVCTYLANEKRDLLISIEEHHKVKIVILPNPNYLIPQHRLEIYNDQIKKVSSKIPSYKSIPNESYVVEPKKIDHEQPAISSLADSPIKTKKATSSKSFFKSLAIWLGLAKKTQKPKRTYRRRYRRNAHPGRRNTPRSTKDGQNQNRKSINRSARSRKDS